MVKIYQNETSRRTQLYILSAIGVWFFVFWVQFIRRMSLPESSESESTTTPPSTTTLALDHRQVALDLRSPFSFLHISKNGGVSWMRELKKIKWADGKKLPLYPNADAGEEHSLSFQDDYTIRLYYNNSSPRKKLQQDPTKSIVRMAILRSPREHVWSQFRQCHLSAWGKRRMKPYKSFYSRTIHKKKYLMYELERWLRLFVEGDNETNTTMIREVPPMRKDDKYLCYHPANFQSRFFSVHDEFPIQIVGHVVEPIREEVAQSVQNLDWVGMLEFFHESKCLLYYRITQSAVPKNANETIRTYLDETCHCDTQERPTAEAKSDSNHANNNTNQSSTVDIKYTHKHGDQGKHVSLLNASQSVLDIVDLLTHTDRYLYKHALVNFLQDIVWMEGQLSRRFMCSPVLQKMSKGLSYLGRWDSSILNSAMGTQTEEPVVARNLMEVYTLIQQRRNDTLQQRR
mmetsp:Transcript_24570/g.68033  ORF Transcript_24570/g.68033 Transcript_24570/m.68033 type:complete len:458 (-) Transcript_24570:114-1487(-)